MRILAPIALIAGFVLAGIGMSALRDNLVALPERGPLASVVAHADIASSVLGSGGGRDDVAEHLARVAEGCRTSGDEKLEKYGGALARATPLATGALLSRIAVTAREVDASRGQARNEEVKWRRALWGYGLLGLGGLFVISAVVERGIRSEKLERAADRIRKVASTAAGGPHEDVAMIVLRERTMREHAIRDSLELVSNKALLARLLESAQVKQEQAEAERDVLEIQSRVCSLTGLLNRDTFIAEAGELLSAHLSGGPGFAVAYLDLDYFKVVNLDYGHHEGSRAISHFGECLKAAAGESCVIGHPHGDEFLVAIPGDVSEVRAFLAAMRETVTSRTFRAESKDGAEFAIRYTSGWVHTSGVELSMVSGDTSDRACQVQVEVLVAWADKPLSEMKSTGRRGGDAEFDPLAFYTHERASDVDPEMLRAYRALERNFHIAAPRLEEETSERLRRYLVDAARIVAPPGHDDKKPEESN